MKSFRRDQVDTFLLRLRKVRRISDNRWHACCPAHDDKHPSLTITVKPDRLLTFCHAYQCPHQDVLSAVDMRIADFYDDAGHAAYRAACAAPLKPLKPISQEDLDREVLRIARAALAAGKTLNLEDQARFELAMERLRDE